MSHTIYGRHNPSDGKIKFGDGNCDTAIDCMGGSVLEACIEVSGAHAGQVKLVVSGADIEACNDTFYGCLNTSTGRFQITLPDSDCCVDADNCGECDEGTPYQIEVVFSGIVKCDNCVPQNGNYKIDHLHVNDTYTLTQDGSDACKWTYSNSGGDYGSVKRYLNPYCTDYSYTFSLDEILIRVLRFADATGISVEMWAIKDAVSFHVFGGVASFDGSLCMEDTLNNGNLCSSYSPADSGAAVITEISW